MIGWLLGTVEKKVLLAKIEYNDKKSNINKEQIVNKENATYITDEFKIIEIVDEYLNKYISININVVDIINSMYEKLIFHIDESYEQMTIFFYLDKHRALQDIYLFNNKSTGIFKQYLPDGSLQNELSVKNGLINGICKNYLNGELIEECEYKSDIKNGLCKKYYDNGNIIEYTLWKNGLMVNEQKAVINN
jgi:antitoxin component YwqK of YwqJK toxin-antitoxin module